MVRLNVRGKSSVVVPLVVAFVITLGFVSVVENDDGFAFKAGHKRGHVTRHLRESVELETAVERAVSGFVSLSVSPPPVATPSSNQAQTAGAMRTNPPPMHERKSPTPRTQGDSLNSHFNSVEEVETTSKKAESVAAQDAQAPAEMFATKNMLSPESFARSAQRTSTRSDDEDSEDSMDSTDDEDIMNNDSLGSDSDDIVSIEIHNSNELDTNLNGSSNLNHSTSHDITSELNTSSAHNFSELNTSGAHNPSEVISTSNDDSTSEPNNVSLFNESEAVAGEQSAEDGSSELNVGDSEIEPHREQSNGIEAISHTSSASKDDDIGDSTSIADMGNEDSEPSASTSSPTELSTSNERANEESGSKDRAIEVRGSEPGRNKESASKESNSEDRNIEASSSERRKGSASGENSGSGDGSDSSQEENGHDCEDSEDREERNDRDGSGESRASDTSDSSEDSDSKDSEMAVREESGRGENVTESVSQLIRRQETLGRNHSELFIQTQECLCNPRNLSTIVDTHARRRMALSLGREHFDARFETARGIVTRFFHASCDPNVPIGTENHINPNARQRDHVLFHALDQGRCDRDKLTILELAIAQTAGV
ncbi:hypothetical protein PsorP6_012580 [Peronosclerospora sorghi]|uniref:Uncharacterized protein n=1 Tax=Peronosclerospora sorghi TaxID=230839 RepID=A0ACC0WI77_9STRA|nr:hypothetical protein PsorP6_012580 [Peronosclerospora sorghi]